MRWHKRPSTFHTSGEATSMTMKPCSSEIISVVTWLVRRMLMEAERSIPKRYADSSTPSMKRAMDETERRRALQDAFNKAHGIIPRSVHKKVQDVIEITSNVPSSSKKKLRSKGEKQQEIARLTRQMKEAAKMLEFEIAAQLRDQIKALENG